jgi:hypothetical protein
MISVLYHHIYKYQHDAVYSLIDRYIQFRRNLHVLTLVTIKLHVPPPKDRNQNTNNRNNNKSIFLPPA